jgi:hypothetical protein
MSREAIRLMAEACSSPLLQRALVVAERGVLHVEQQRHHQRTQQACGHARQDHRDPEPGRQHPGAVTGDIRLLHRAAPGRQPLPQQRLRLTLPLTHPAALAEQRPEPAHRPPAGSMAWPAVRLGRRRSSRQLLAGLMWLLRVLAIRLRLPPLPEPQPHAAGSLTYSAAGTRVPAVHPRHVQTVRRTAEGSAIQAPPGRSAASEQTERLRPWRPESVAAGHHFHQEWQLGLVPGLRPTARPRQMYRAATCDNPAPAVAGHPAAPAPQRPACGTQILIAAAGR